MDYLGILKRAYEISIKHRYLWIFGILSGGAGLNANITLPSGSGEWTNKLDKLSNIRFENYLSHYWGVLIAIFGLILLLGILWLAASVISQGALLGSVVAIEKKEKNNFWTGFAYGAHKFWKVFAFGLLIFLMVIATLIILGLPIVLFVVAKVYALAIIYGILVFLLDIVFWIYLGVMQPYILRSTILGGKGVWEAFASSWEFFQKNWQEIVVIYLILLAIGIGVGLGFLMVLLIFGGLLFAIGFGIYLAFQSAVWIYAGIAGLAFAVLLLCFGGIFNTFTSSILTLTYLEFEKKS